MGKGIHYILVVLCLFIGTGNSVGNCVKRVYDSQVGVRELTGKNDGAEVKTYLAAAGIYVPAPWCAAFVKWCFDSCGVATTSNAWSPSWFPANRVILSAGKMTATPKAGDVFGLYYANLKRIGHVGFVDEWGAEMVLTVEGNTNGAGSREGDGVYRKRRLVRQINKVSRWLGC